MDLGDKKESPPSSSSPPLICGGGDDQANESEKKCCADCRTTRTPLWRCGPSGPKSLCNACGIRYRKNMVSVMRWRNGNERIKRDKIVKSHNHNHNNYEANERLKVQMKFMGLVKKQKSLIKKTKLGEEEQAAVLLMSLSCGSAFS